ncbi:hypothetical protein NDU88_006735 [Pleurodeles waltl]|uniref:Uncharacterized protein n=1 Tax=Pleurodeles waltl TaxID=8319 RepID=A0AAV7MD36_PLEWA|nr:hypothetical protein NDU88_006735 [Pleurodeles waltl]
MRALRRAFHRAVRFSLPARVLFERASDRKHFTGSVRLRRSLFFRSPSRGGPRGQRFSPLSLLGAVAPLN